MNESERIDEKCKQTKSGKTDKMVKKETTNKQKQNNLQTRHQKSLINCIAQQYCS